MTEPPGNATAWPTVSVVVVTHNGRHQLERGLTALELVDYPADRLQRVVVDNASGDDSAALVAERFPGITLLRATRNLGFAAANNWGFRAAPAEFLVTLNDDTEVSPDWLKALLRPALDDPTVGLCTGKLILTQNRLTVRVDADNLALVAAWLDERPVAVEQLGPVAGPRRDYGLPVKPSWRPRGLRLRFDRMPNAAFTVAVGEQPARIYLPDQGATLALELPTDLIARPVIQNAGTLIFRDGRARDRGAVAGPGYHYYEDDRGQFDRSEEVFAGCGASLLLRAATLVDVGGFDERFFMYYEDVDLSWRARLRRWKVVYAANAVVRHVHRGSSGSWSERFVYQTERNRLLMLLKLAPPERALGQLGRSGGAAIFATLAMVRRAARRDLPSRAWAGPRLAALASLARELPGLLDERARIQVRRRASRAEIDRWLVDPT